MIHFQAGFPADQAAAALQITSLFLSKRQIPCLTAEHLAGKIGLIVVAGSAILDSLDAAAAAYRVTGCRILVTGGIGHSTPFLYQALSSTGVSIPVNGAGPTEAELLCARLKQDYALPPEQLLIECRSSHTGENALFSLAAIQESIAMPSRMLLIQDPLLQLRTEATFRKVWQDAGLKHVDFISYAPFLPTIQVTAEGRILLGGSPFVWSEERFLSLLMGEFARLWDDEHGYGPQGKGFIQQVPIPQSVRGAYRFLEKWLTPLGEYQR